MPFQDRNNENNDKSKKNKTGKNSNNKSQRFLSCFRPPFMGHSVQPEREKSGSRRDQAFKFIKMEGNGGGAVLPRIVSGSSLQDSDDSMPRPTKKNHKNNFSHTFKALLFETSLAKKMKKRKFLQKFQLNNERPSMITVKDSNPRKYNPINSTNQEDEANISNATSSVNSCMPSSCSSSFSSITKALLRDNSSNQLNEMEVEVKPDALQGQAKLCFCSNVGLYLIIICLLGLAFWGKVCAIVCTTVWLFLVPQWHSGSKMEQIVRADSWKLDLEDYNNKNKKKKKLDLEEHKRKIIMQGLLERNRNCGL